MNKKSKLPIKKAEQITQLQAAAEMYGADVKVPETEQMLQTQQTSSKTPIGDNQNNSSQPVSTDDNNVHTGKQSNTVTPNSTPVDEPATPHVKQDPQLMALPSLDSTIEKPRVKNIALKKADMNDQTIAHEKAEKQGMEEAIKEEAKKQIQDTAKMQELIDTAPRPLLEISAVFPFDLFPSRLTIEETRVNIIFRQFFATEQVRSITIQDIMEVTVQTALFFASLKIVSRTFNPTNTEPLEIKYLKTADAQKARRLIEGLKLAIQQQVDTSKMNVDELIAKADELGKIHQGNTAQ